jgi:hypothetical protein
MSHQRLACFQTLLAQCAQLSVRCLLTTIVGPSCWAFLAIRDFQEEEERRKESKQAESEEQQRDALEKEGEKHIEAAKRSLQKNSYADARMSLQRARLGAVSLVSARSAVHPLCKSAPEVRVVSTHSWHYCSRTHTQLTHIHICAHTT